MSYDTTHSALLPARTKWILTSTEALSQSHFEWYNRLIYSSDEEMIVLALALRLGRGIRNFASYKGGFWRCPLRPIHLRKLL